MYKKRKSTHKTTKTDNMLHTTDKQKLEKKNNNENTVELRKRRKIEAI